MNNNNILKTSLLILSILLLISCEKEYKPVSGITTLGVTEITATSAVCGGKLDAYWDNLSMGIVCSTNPYPESNMINTNAKYDDSVHEVLAENISLTGNSFSCEIPGLAPNTKYYVRAYVKLKFVSSKNEREDIIKYGEQLEFTTLAE